MADLVLALDQGISSPTLSPLRPGLLVLLLAPAVDRWWEQFDAWVDERLSRRV